MNDITFNELKGTAKDIFSSILISCPNWPPVCKTNTNAKFEQLVGFIDIIIDRTKTEEAKQWMRICLQEVRQSWKCYQDGNLSDGRKLIQVAQAHFDNSLAKKPIEARFTVGESGAALDAEKGFPS